MKYRPHSGLGPLSPPRPFLGRTHNSRKSNNKIPAPINHKSPAAPCRGQRETPPKPDSSKAAWRTSTSYRGLSRPRSPHALIFMTLSVTPWRRQSHAASVGLGAFIYLLVFLQVVTGSLGLYWPQSTQTVPVKSEPPPFYWCRNKKRPSSCGETSRGGGREGRAADSVS